MSSKLFWPKRRTVISENPSRILLIRVDGIGDLVMVIGAIWALRQQHPGAKIDLLTSDAASTIANLLVDAKYIDRVYVLPLLNRTRVLQREMASTLRAQNYDVAFDLRGDMRNILIAWLANIPRRVGPAGTALSYLLTDRVIIPKGTHQLHECNQLFATLGSPEAFAVDAKQQTQLPLRTGDLDEAKEWLEQNGRQPGKLLVAIHPSAFVPSKVWPLERFVEVAKRLLQNGDCQVVVVGGKAELDSARQFAEQVKPFEVIVATGQTSLLTTAAILARCAVMIGNDSGPAHLAASVGATPVVMFACVNVERYHPVTDKLVVLRPASPCDPKCDRTCATPDRHCMLEYTPDRVVELAKEAMDATAK